MHPRNPSRSVIDGPALVNHDPAPADPLIKPISYSRGWWFGETTPITEADWDRQFNLRELQAMADAIPGPDLPGTTEKVHRFLIRNGISLEAICRMDVEAIRTHVEAFLPVQPSAQPQPNRAEIDWLPLAMGLVAAKPYMLLKEIAKKIGIHEKTLSKKGDVQDKFRAFRKKARAKAKHIPHGVKDKDGNLEAW